MVHSADYALDAALITANRILTSSKHSILETMDNPVIFNLPSIVLHCVLYSEQVMGPPPDRRQLIVGANLKIWFT